jgi:hypothetical protein
LLKIGGVSRNLFFENNLSGALVWEMSREFGPWIY